VIPRSVLVRTLIVLAVTQLIGWGTVGLIAIVGRQMADDLHMDIATVFAGNSILYLVMGLCAPLLAKTFAKVGARLVMICGTLVAVPGFAVLALAQGPAVYGIAWVILGMAGSATLTTPAFILLNEVVGRNARSAIGALMLVTGLSSSLFWPIALYLSHAVGWRATCLIYAAMMALLSLPLLIFGLPRPQCFHHLRFQRDPDRTAQGRGAGNRRGRRFRLGPRHHPGQRPRDRFPRWRTLGRHRNRAVRRHRAAGRHGCPDRRCRRHVVRLGLHSALRSR
jgi:MFS family permease